MSAALSKLMKPAGPVSGAFVNSTAYIKGIMGPVGGGKTVACVANCIKLAFAQEPFFDPVRNIIVKKCRIGVIRDTYPNLDRTVIKTWHQWIPKTFGHWSGDAPRVHKLSIEVAKGTPQHHFVELEMLFAGIGDNNVEDVLRGWELTALWINEWDLVAAMILQLGIGRVGRYPSKGADSVPSVLPTIFGDFNAPDEDNHLYDLFVNKKIDPELEAKISALTGGNRKLIEFFEQPGGLDENAENLQNLEGGRAYYELQAAVLSADMARRMIHNKFGSVQDGLPVYPEFSNAVHVAGEELKPIAGVPLRIGLDGGATLNPAAVIFQRNSIGQYLILDELTVYIEDGGEPDKVGPTQFAEALVDLLAVRYAGFDIELVAADPAAFRGGDGKKDKSWAQIVAKICKFHIRPAPCPDNDITMRTEAVRRPLKRTVEAGRPGLLVSPRCKVLRRGFNGGYKYKRTALTGGEGRYENRPAKNQFSHPHDALQYGLLASGEGRILEAVGHGVQKRGGGGVTVDADYNPFS